VTPALITRLRNYLCKRFDTEGITIRRRQVKDSVEVYLNDEILGILYIDDEDPNDVSYDLNISILEQDLDA